MALNELLGIQALVQSYDDKAVDQALKSLSSKIGKSVDEVNDELNKISIDKDVINNIVNQLKSLPEEVRKKTQGMSFDLFSDLINADGAEEKIDEAINIFSNKIKSFNKLREQIGNDKIIIETDLSDLDKLADKMREVIELESQLKGKRGKEREKIGSNLKSAQDEIDTWIQARQQVDKYDVSLEEVKNTVTKLANEFRNKKLGNFNFIDKNNIKEIQEMIGWLERYVQLSGDVKLSGLKDFGIKNGVMDLRQLYQGEINTNNSNLKKQYQEYVDIVKKYMNLNKGTGSGNGSETNDNFGFEKSKENAESLLSTVKEIRDILNQFKENKSFLDSEEINTLKQKISELDTQISDIQSKFKNIEKGSFDKTEGNVSELLNEAYDQVISVQDELQGLDNNIFSEMKNDISNLINKLDEMNKQLQKFTSLSSNVNIPEVESKNDVTDENIKTINSDVIKEQNKLQSELKETDDIVQKIVYHWGELDTEKLGKSKSESFNKMISSYISGIRDSGEPWGAFGTGTYVTSDPNYFKGIDTSERPFSKFNELDVSKLKMYETKTTENAKALFEFLNTLQQYCISFASGYDYQGTFDVNQFNTEKLFNSFQTVFKESKLTFEQFEVFLNNMFDLVEQAGVKVDGSMSPKANMIVGNDNIATRFMKELGYQGINNAGTDFDSLQHGSVIFDIDKSNIVNKYKTIEELLVVTEQQAKETAKAIENINDSGINQDKSQTEIKETKNAVQELGAEAQEAKQKLEDLSKVDVNPKIDSKETSVSSSIPGGDNISQSDSSSIVSEQQALEKLEQAINSVTNAIAQKNKAIQAEEVQMDLSVNQEIKKLEELKSKLNEIKTQFEQGVTNGLFKDTDNNNIIIPGEVILSPKLSENFKSSADELLDDIKIEKKVELKIEELNDNNQNIGDIKEQIESATENLDLKSTIGNINPYKELLSKDFSTKNSTEAWKQLKEAFNEFKDFYNDEKKLATEEGRKAAYNYYMSYKEALSKHVANSRMIANTPSYDDFYDSERIYKYWSSKEYNENNEPELGIDLTEFKDIEKYLKEFSNVYDDVVSKIGNKKIDQELIDDIDIYVDSLLRLQYVQSEIKRDNSLFSQEDINEKKVIINNYKEILDNHIDYYKKYGESIKQSADKAKSAIVEVNDELNKSQKLQQPQVPSVESQTGNEQEDKKSEVIAIPVEPLIDQTEWENKIDDILKAIGTKKIKIEPDTTSQEWNDFKTFINEISNKVLSLKIDTNNENISNTGKIASSVTSSENNSIKDKIKKRDRHVEVASSVETEQEVNQRSQAIQKATNDLIESLKEQGKTITEYTAFYDSQMNLVKTQFKEVSKIKGEDGLPDSYKTTNWTTRFDKEGKYAYSSNIDNFNFEKARKDYEKQLAQQEKHAKEVTEAQRKYEEQQLAEKKKREAEYTSWWEKELNTREQIQQKREKETYDANVAEANKLVSNQLRTWQDIYSVKAKIAKLDSSNETEKVQIEKLREQEKLLKENFNSQKKQLDALNKYYNKQDYDKNLTNISALGEKDIESSKAELQKRYKSLQDKSNKKQSDNDKANITEANKLLNQQEATYKKIYDIKAKIAALDPDNEVDSKQIESLEQQKKLLQENFLIQKKQLDSLSQYYNKQDYSKALSNIAVVGMKNVEVNAAKLQEKLNKQSTTTATTPSNKNLERLNALYDQQLATIKEIKSLESINIDNRTIEQNKRLTELNNELLKIHKDIDVELDSEYKKTEKIQTVLDALVKTREKVNTDGIQSISLDQGSFSGRETDIGISYDEAQKVNTALNKTLTLMGELSKRNITNFDKPFDEAKTKIEQLNQRLESGSINLIDYNKAVNKIVSGLKNIVAVLDETSDRENGIKEIERYLSEISNGNYKIINDKTLGDVTTLTAEFVDQNKQLQRVKVSYNDVNKQIVNLGSTGKKNITSLSKFLDELNVKFRNLGTYLLSFVGFYEVWGAIKQGVTYITELDSALTEMKKVSDESIESLRNFQDVSFDIADNIGSTAKEIQNSTADWLKLGYAIEDASELAEATAIYKNVGDNMDITEATQSMVSTLEGFQLEADQAMNIVDQFNEVSNRFAIDSKGIGDALQRSAASFNAANTGMSEAIALITATNSVLQDPDKVGM